MYNNMNVGIGLLSLENLFKVDAFIFVEITGSVSVARRRWNYFETVCFEERFIIAIKIFVEQ